MRSYPTEVRFQVNETMEELVEEISELLVPAEKYDKEDAVVEVLKTFDLHCTNEQSFCQNLGQRG